MATTVTGTDNASPVYDPAARWCWWSLSEIYTGGVGTNKYVPKVNDYIEDTDLQITYKVVSIDETTLVATMSEIKLAGNTSTFTEDDILFGVGPGTQSDTYLCYVDKSVVPYVLAVDARLKVGGSTTSYAKIFRGSDVSSTGKLVGALYDQGGTLLGNNIPLELAAVDSHTNHTIKTVAVAYTRDSLVDGEIVTVVLYSDTGHVISKRQLLVENTAFIRSVSASLKYVSHISLKTPFLAAGNDHNIEFPLNVPVGAMNLVGVVHYSDGSTLEMPVDGTRFRVFGMDQYVSTVIGQKLGLVLNYALDSNEQAYGAVSGDGKYMSEQYTLITIDSINAYTVKLYGYPVWIDAVSGYRLQWFLCNLERNMVFDVTEHVRINTNSAPFKPLSYGTLQELSVSVNLNAVNSTFKAYIHVQTISFVLLGQGTERTTNWNVGFEPDQDPFYGPGLFAKQQMVNQNLWKLRLGSGLATQAAWLQKVYRATLPLYDVQREVEAPTPNCFAISYNGNRQEFELSSWNAELQLTWGIPFSGTIFIEFFKRTTTNDIQLGVAALPVYEY
jgi:hypothetical protein